MDFHLKKGGRMEVEEADASTREYGDGGKKLKACERKERQDTEAIFIDSTSVALFFPCCATQSPHKEVAITEYLCGYCTLLCCSLILPKSTCRIILR